MSSTPSEVEKALDAVMEELAAIEHTRWASWQRYLHDRGARQPDGSILLPADLVARWEEQIRTEYERLSESEKESDREQVRKYLPVIRILIQREQG